MIGREKEKETLIKLYNSSKSEFAVIYGRRRIGKTYLVRETFSGKFAFSHTGLANSNKSKQLENFYNSLKRSGYAGNVPTDWLEAFQALESVLNGLRKRKKIVFIDEVPWIDTPKSDFLPAFEHFWNDWASARKDILLIICGSATSWIVKKVFKSRGGLHNRVTCRIPLQAFCLAECAKYAKERKLVFNRRQITEIYMALGGVAYYWSLLSPSFGVAQNIDMLFFDDNAPLRDEFDELYSSLFKNEEPYIKIVFALGKIRIGLTRNEISKKTGIESSGSLTQYLKELEQCGFIRHYSVIGSQKKGTIYQLTDNYTLFYFGFLHEKVTSNHHYWTNTLNTPIQNTWQGLAFERICIMHSNQIKMALGINGINTEVYAWKKAATEEHDGAQIDIVIDRNDGIINLCEIKFTNKPYAITKRYNDELQNKIDVFRQETHTGKAIHLTMITSNGLKRNTYTGNIQNEISLDNLFVYSI